MTRVCSKCKIKLSIEQFSKNKYKKTGVNYECKSCQKIYKDAHYQNNKQKYKDKAKRHDKKMQEWWQEFKSKLKCVRCGFSHPAALDFHHLYGKDKAIAQGRSEGWGKKRVLEEINKCEVLCSNCHRILHWEEKQ
jgi:hypothetical protein